MLVVALDATAAVPLVEQRLAVVPVPVAPAPALGLEVGFVPAAEVGFDLDLQLVGQEEAYWKRLGCPDGPPSRDDVY